LDILTVPTEINVSDSTVIGFCQSADAVLFQDIVEIQFIFVQRTNGKGSVFNTGSCSELQSMQQSI
jgi:hypothetical protein